NAAFRRVSRHCTRRPLPLIDAGKLPRARATTWTIGHNMARIVMKFGGTSVADLDRIHTVARHVKREVDAGNEVAVVVSAMSGKTNELVGWVQGMPKVTGAGSPFYDAREYDSVVASGEQVTSGLLAIALQSMGVNARSWQG